MKKLAYLMSLCIVFFGVFAFAGCSDGTEIKNIKVTERPTLTTYTVGQDLMLDGGKLTVEYKDGKKQVFDLAIASPNITKFDNAGAITVTMSYKNFADTFEVRVNPKDFTPEYQHSISTVYNGEAQPAVLFNTSQLPLGMSVTSTEYKVEGAADNTYSTNTPTNAGVYTVRVKLNGGNNYVDKELISTYTIEKANYVNFTTNACLSFKGLNTINYSDDFDLSKMWAQSNSNNTLGAIPLNSTLAQNITYSYMKDGETFATPFTPGENGKIWAKLDAGKYTIIVNGRSTDNIKPFTITSKLTVLAKELELGTDYQIIIKKGTQNIEYIAPINATIQTIIESDLTEEITVEIEFLSDASRYCTLNSISFGAGASGNDITNIINNYDTYRILPNITCESGNYTLSADVYNAFNVVSI